jgi:hypothetical protein
MFTELDVLADVGNRLDSAGVPFMLTGSLALSYYAAPRMTRDIDIVISVSHTDASQLAAVFAPDYYVSDDDVARAVRSQGMFNILHMDSVIKVDLVVRKNSTYRVAEFERRKRVELAGIATWIVAKEDLILSKLVWAKDSHSDFQLRDVRSLLATGFDRDYLQLWAPQLGVAELLQEVSA